MSTARPPEGARTVARSAEVLLWTTARPSEGARTVARSAEVFL